MEISPIISSMASVMSSYYMKKSSDTQKAALKAERAANQRQYELDSQQSQLALAEERRRNRNLLAQQESAYRARLGAAGLSSRSGTGQAVLDAMQKEYDTEDKYLINQANISLEALLNGINAKNTRNLLNASSANNTQRANTINSVSNWTSTAGRSVLK